MIDPSLSLSTNDPRSLVRFLADHGVPSSLPPNRLSIDYQPGTPPPEDWGRAVLAGSPTATVSWPRPSEGVSPFVAYDHRDGVFKLRTERVLTCGELVPILAGAPFVLAASDSHHEWLRGLDYSPVGFDGQHFGHGWMCAFKGEEGHAKLVHRRWLEHGPWRLIRVPEVDLSIVQFHDLEADPATAMEQARPGHQLLGVSDVTGIFSVWIDRKRQHDLRGHYVPDTRTYEIVVIGREVSPRELLEAAWVARQRRSDPTQPIEHLAYVFLEPEAARRHLHALWLRGLRCYAIDAGTKIRLDDTYVPPPHEPPAWVRRVEAQTTGPNAR